MKREGFGYVTASKMLVEGKRKVRFMYRKESDNPQSSGWNFFCGDEDDEYIRDPDNIAIYDINTILDIDPSIAPFLSHSFGTALEREDEISEFVFSETFDFNQ